MTDLLRGRRALHACEGTRSKALPLALSELGTKYSPELVPLTARQYGVAKTALVELELHDLVENARAIIGRCTCVSASKGRRDRAERQENEAARGEARLPSAEIRVRRAHRVNRTRI